MISYPNVKLNLGLNILRKRPDGYHDLETLFIPYFGISDKLEITEDKEDSIFVENSTWDPHSDLCWKALSLLRENCVFPRVRINLHKYAPVGAGLGSGSSDCVFTMRMLNEMFSLGLSDSDLVALASKLGSDCPFFVYNKAMFGEGRGEVLTPHDIDLSGYDIKVSVPQDITVSTREAYSGIHPHLPEISLREVLSRPIGEWKNLLINDFEESVFSLHPGIASLKQQFYNQGAIYSSMSGSGSSVFGIFPKE